MNKIRIVTNKIVIKAFWEITFIVRTEATFHYLSISLSMLRGCSSHANYIVIVTTHFTPFELPFRVSIFAPSVSHKVTESTGSSRRRWWASRRSDPGSARRSQRLS